VVGGWIVKIFYGEMIAPLQFKLVENSSYERTSGEAGRAWCEAPLILRTRKLKVERERERETVNEKKIVKRYNEEFKRQAVELLIHSGKRQAQVARELGVSDYTLTLWKRAYLGQLKPGELEGKPLSPEEMLETIRQLQKENEYLKRQREILKKAMSIVGEEPNPGMR
jgi:transposase